MTADTVHLLAQLIRFNRGVATAIETWARKQPESDAGRELTQLLAVYRGVLTTLEYQVSQVTVDGPQEPQTADGVGALT